jgi:hypothetical protein
MILIANLTTGLAVDVLVAGLQGVDLALSDLRRAHRAGGRWCTVRATSSRWQLFVWTAVNVSTRIPGTLIEFGAPPRRAIACVAA